MAGKVYENVRFGLTRSGIILRLGLLFVMERCILIG